MTYFGKKSVDQKLKPFVSKAWRQSAKGQDCTINLYGCDGGGETTVLAHIRLFAMAGVGQKPHDFCSLYACGPCHKKLDEAPHLWEYEDVLRGLLKTLSVHYREGRIKDKTQ